MTEAMHPLNFTGPSGHQDVETYDNSSNAENNDRDHELRTNEQDLLYHKQYCNQIKTIQSDMIRTNNGALPEINTTTRKMPPTLQIVCGKNEVIVDRCGTWSKNIRNCSDKKGATIDAKSVALSAHQTPSKIADTTMKKPLKMCPFNPLSKCEIGKSNKPPNLKTQNTFISRLFLTDILDNI